MLDPKLLEGSPPYDVVFCRNLLIYLDAPARNCVLAALDRLLAADGVLFIGHADRLERAGEPSRFTAVGESGCFAYRKMSGEWAVGSGERNQEWAVGSRQWAVGREQTTGSVRPVLPTPPSALPKSQRQKMESGEPS